MSIQKIVNAPTYPKIFALGHRKISNLLENPVEITEKVDGSQFRFGKLNSQLLVASKGTLQSLEQPDALFHPAVSYIREKDKIIPDNIFFFGETLRGPKHNVLKYERVPKNHIALFGAMHWPEETWLPWEDLYEWAEVLDVDVVPLLQQGLITKNGDELIEYMDTLLNLESYLGGPLIEGIVVKNLHQDAMIGNQYLPFLTGKFVSEKFKEVHRDKSYGRRKQKESWDTYMDSFRTEARWRKTIQHLREMGQFNGELRDIGTCIKEIQSDIKSECEDEIKEALWKFFGDQLLRNAHRGFPEWYKEQLAKGEFDADQH